MEDKTTPENMPPMVAHYFKKTICYDDDDSNGDDDNDHINDHDADYDDDDEDDDSNDDSDDQNDDNDDNDDRDDDNDTCLTCHEKGLRSSCKKMLHTIVLCLTDVHCTDSCQTNSYYSALNYGFTLLSNALCTVRRKLSNITAWHWHAVCSLKYTAFH